MLNHFRQIEFLHNNATVQIPNSIFKQLSEKLKKDNGERNSIQVSFAYAYLVATAFLYKYAHFVDVSAGTYVQNSDMKKLLGYNAGTKSIDRIIAKDGLLEQMGLVQTTRDFPVYFSIADSQQKDNRQREFVLFSELDSDHVLRDRIRAVVKNRNYEIRDPLFLTGHEDDEGTLNDFRSTHKITIQELVTFLGDDSFDNLDFLVYAYLKSRCQGEPNKGKSLALVKIMADIGMDSGTFYRRLANLKEKEFIHVTHGKWKTNKTDQYIRMVANHYFWKGVS